MQIGVDAPGSEWAPDRLRLMHGEHRWRRPDVPHLAQKPTDRPRGRDIVQEVLQTPEKSRARWLLRAKTAVDLVSRSSPLAAGARQLSRALEITATTTPGLTAGVTPKNTAALDPGHRSPG